jgi:methionyl-tRNA formyltransferase
LQIERKFAICNLQFRQETAFPQMPATPPYRLVMMGTGAFAEPTFEALFTTPHQVVGLVTQPDQPQGHVRGSTRRIGPGMKGIAEKHGVLVFQPESVNTPEGIAALQSLRPDLLVVAAYGQILSPEVLGVPPLGGINVHASLLPKYRGAAPIAWAIYHGETRTGVTIIKMSPSLDAGDMLAQEALDIGPQETAGELETRLAPLGARLAVQVIGQTAAGTVHGVKQDKSLATKAPKLKKEHGLIDWNRTAEQVCNHVRAMQPWPTPYTFLHRQGKAPQRLIICRAVPVSVRSLPLMPAGTPFTNEESPDYLFVIAGVSPGGEGVKVVGVQELQPAGKKRMTVVQFLRGHPLQPGDRLGLESP